VPVVVTVDPNALTIVFGSCTGTAEHFAKTLAADGKRRGFRPKVISAADFATSIDGPLFAGSDAARHSDVAETRTFVFILATYGEGDPTDDFREGWQNLKQISDQRRQAPPQTQVAVFGLGDSSYKYFCEMAKKVDEACRRMGCEFISETKFSDARGEMEMVFDEWRENFWSALASKESLTLLDAPLIAELEFNFLNDGSAADPSVFPPPPSKLEPTMRKPTAVRIKSIEEMIVAGGYDGKQSTKNIVLDIEKLSIVYQGGDHCGILPSNNDVLVDRCLKVLHAEQDADTLIELTSEVRSKTRATKINQLPSRQSLRTALKWFVDLSGIPKKSTLRVCAQYCTDDAQKADFTELLRIGNDIKYREACQRYHNIVGFLEAFPSCGVSIGHFLETLPRVAPRMYSIASDQLIHTTELHLTVGLIPDSKGMCTSMLSQMKAGDQLFIFVRKSQFHLPFRFKDSPMIFIGPGTGIAPLIGFCQRREAWAKKQALGPCYFFFGCRNQHADFIHGASLLRWQSEPIGPSLMLSGSQQSIAGSQLISAGSPDASPDRTPPPEPATCERRYVITPQKLLVAFSRDQPEKIYVQHKLREVGAEVIQLMLGRPPAYLYICGDATHMARDVENTLVDLLQEHGGLPSAESARAKLVQLEKDGRYLKDVWTT
jgi:NADPH-ferrihemoprotein reductase